MAEPQNPKNHDVPHNNDQGVQPESSQLNVDKLSDSHDSEPNEVKENLPSSAVEPLGAGHLVLRDRACDRGNRLRASRGISFFYFDAAF
jgi:hypothetical protein